MTARDVLVGLLGEAKADQVIELGVADAPSRATREEALADWLAHHRETAT